MDSAWLQGFLTGLPLGAGLAVMVIVALMIAAKRWEQRQ